MSDLLSTSFLLIVRPFAYPMPLMAVYQRITIYITNFQVMSHDPILLNKDEKFSLKALNMVLIELFGMKTCSMRECMNVAST